MPVKMSSDAAQNVVMSYGTQAMPERGNWNAHALILVSVVG